jgi:hypothetical protein
MSEPLLWWGYIHVNGSVKVKRYLDSEDMREAANSGFVKKIFTEFSATSLADAQKKLKRVMEYKWES